MKLRAAWLLALCAAAGAAYAADIFVSTTGSDTTGDGSQGAPFRTLQHAVDVAQPAGDRIRVLAGTYNECVNTTSTSVAIVANDCLTDQDPCAKTAIIDGTGICDAASGTPAAALLLWDDSSLRGFTVKGGGDAGVKALGDVVITKNEITGNVGFQGGGIYLDARALFSGTHLAEISNNLIRNNTAEVDGGGVFARVIAAPNFTQQVQITKNTIRDNVAQGFPLQSAPFLPGGYGGGLAAYSFTNALGLTEIVITENVIEGNSAELNSMNGGYYFGSYGGGMWASTLYGTGTETIRIKDNQVRTNTARNTGGGISAWAQGTSGSTHTVQVEGNSVSSNGADEGGGGLDLFMRSLDLGSGSLKIQVTSNELTGNRGDGFFGGGGLAAYSLLRRTDVPANEFSIRANTIRGNTTNSFGGGASLLLVADADPDNGGATATTTSLVRFERNLVAGNRANSSVNDAAGGGVAVELQAKGDASAEAQLDFNTLAVNVADLGGGGVDVFTQTTFDTAGAAEGATFLVLSNSIVDSNTGFAVGGPVPGGTQNFSIESLYNDLFGNTSGVSEGAIASFVTQTGNLFLDPLLDANFVPDVCSPTVDAADPAASASLEPEPNGDRANQGDLGGTAGAVRTLPDVTGDGLVDGVDVLRVASAFASDAVLTPLRYFPAADRDNDGDVDGDDLSYVAAFYGTSCP